MIYLIWEPVPVIVDNILAHLPSHGILREKDGVLFIQTGKDETVYERFETHDEAFKHLEAVVREAIKDGNLTPYVLETMRKHGLHATIHELHEARNMAVRKMEAERSALIATSWESLEQKTRLLDAMIAKVAE